MSVPSITITSQEPFVAESVDVDLLVILSTKAGPLAGLNTRAALGDALTRAAQDASALKDLAYYPTGLRGAPRVCAVHTDEIDSDSLRAAAGKAGALARRLKAERVGLALPSEAAPADAAAITEGFLLGAYAYTRYKTRPEDQAGGVSALIVHLDTIAESAHSAAEAAIRQAEASATAAAFARDLVNLAPGEKSALDLAEAIKERLSEAGVDVAIWDRKKIEKENMAGLLAVNRGSIDPPAFVVLRHRPKNVVNEKPIVLVGKAVVFDTGGLSLKPTKGSMDSMKADMGGGAAVAAAVLGAALMKLPLDIVALIPATDNRPGENAYVPGEVVAMRSGATVEVLNTDAEGRMILADALDVAKSYEPEAVVDVATLTGAQRVALGDRVAAAMAGKGADVLQRQLVEAGDLTGEYLAPLPMHAFYKKAIISDVADIKNVGGPGGGAITAAKFLEHFTLLADGEPAYPWVHLDIAGPSFLESPEPYRPKGGTGFGARLLIEWLRARAERS